MHADEKSERHHLPPGAATMLLLPEGNELYCVKGSVHIATPASVTGDSFTTARALPVGQAWRSGQAQWVALRNTSSTPCIVARVQPLQSVSATPKENRLAAFAARRFQESLKTGLLWLRRGPSAASMKTP